MIPALATSTIAATADALAVNDMETGVVDRCFIYFQYSISMIILSRCVCRNFYNLRYLRVAIHDEMTPINAPTVIIPNITNPIYCMSISRR